MRLVLTEQQSEFIRQSGERFLIVHPGSYPTTEPGRMVLELIPTTFDRAKQACEVAQGKLKAFKPREKR